MNKFDFSQCVRIERSGEQGVVVAHVQYIPKYGEDSYLIEYTDAHGCACEGWFRASELVASGQPIPTLS